ncbi:hypothetical protein [Paracraurococcus lichenis]|uniref:Sialate O-acetylesterase domain-containing protein n=1 Tax=Paracraurococcus lichenis TaxID=3064888 RepID=A0ABT9E369_9PROT|nr:hypothetical protein [Paracraurococcus sp. LOR1-02]MDO9710594.1 hypothetical protein [Paracraurococcus sp. LOR1-02]
MERGQNRRWARAALGLALLLVVRPAGALPPPDCIHALEGATARIPLPPGPGAWAVRDQAGRPVRPAGPADADGGLRVPPGGWYRLYRDDAPVGGRFAAGHVVLVTGQSQAGGLFFATWPQVGAHPVGPADPPAPPVSAVLEGCREPAGCPWGETRWRPAGEALGARILLAELARLRPGIPVALADTSWGNAGILDLLDPAGPARPYLVRVAEAAAPASALLVLAHGTSDALARTPPAAYAAGVGALAGLLRAAGGNPAMPALQAPLAPLRDAVALLGSGRLAGLAGITSAGHWTLALGLAWHRPLDPATAAQAGAIRYAQAEAARRFGLLPGGDMAAVESGADGIHWSAEGVRRAAREAAAALAAALPPP